MGKKKLLTGISAAFACALAAPASAEQRVETFESYPVGQTLETAVPDVRFPTKPQVFDPVRVGTASETRALRNPAACPSSACSNGAYKMKIEFARPVRSVAVRLGNDDGTCFEFCAHARMVGYGAQGQIVADSLYTGPRPALQEPGQYGPITVPVSLSTSRYTIHSVVIFTGQEENVPGATTTSPIRVQLDNLAFDIEPPFTPDPGSGPGSDDPPGSADPPSDPGGSDPGTQQPDDEPEGPPLPVISISEPSEGAQIEALRGFWVRGHVQRQGVLAGLCLAIDRAERPVSCSGGEHADGSYELYVSGVPAGPHTITVWAVDPLGREVSESIRIQATGVDNIGIDVLDVNQAIQEYRLPRPAGLRRTPGISYAHREQTYRGVPLAKFKRTIVRMHAFYAGARPLRPAPPAFLYGFRKGRDGSLTRLPNSPLRPTASPAGLGSAALELRRATTDAPYEFDLPGSWLDDNMLLVGEVNRPGLPQSPTERANFLADNALAMFVDDIHRRRAVRVDLIEVTYPGWSLPANPSEPFTRMRQIWPRDIEVWWRGTVDATDLAAKRKPDSEDVKDELIERVQTAKDVWGLENHTIGIHGGIFGGRAWTPFVAGFLDIAEEQVAIARANRPLTSLGHELVHLLSGSDHAGERCPDDDDPGSWPPDQRGYIQGWGVDVTGGRGRAGYSPPASGHTEVFSNYRAGLFTPVTSRRDYDLMSYCITNTSEDNDSWIGRPRWYWELGRNTWPHADAAGSDGAPVAPLRDALRVDFELLPDGRVEGLETRRVQGRIFPAASDAEVALATLDGSGNVIRRAAAREIDVHSHDGQAGTRRFSGYLPPEAAAAAVGVQIGGAIRGKVDKGAAAPSVRLTGPNRGSVRRDLKVEWSASDPDATPLQARVELSLDGGKTWRPLVASTYASSTTVPAGFLSRTANGRVRVTVDDGFDTARAVSGRLRIAGRAPAVRIDAPVAGQRVAADAQVVLQGGAIDDRGAPLAGKSLVWYAGKKRIARGSAATAPASDLQGRLRLVARDRFGREGEARTRVRVKRVTPVFTRFAVPHKLGRRKRAFAIRLASSLPARLDVRGRGIRALRGLRVGPAQQSVRVRVRRSKPLKLRLSLRALGRKATVVRKIGRGG